MYSYKNNEFDDNIHQVIGICKIHSLSVEWNYCDFKEFI